MMRIMENNFNLSQKQLEAEAQKDKQRQNEQKYKDKINRDIYNTMVGNPILSDDASSLPLIQYIDPPLPPKPDFCGQPINDTRKVSHMTRKAFEIVDPVAPYPISEIKTYRMPPSPKTEKQEIDLHIDVTKRIVHDPVYDWDFDDDSTHIRNETVPVPADTYIPKISLNLPPPEAKQSVPPIEKPKINTVEFEDTCPVPWLTQKPTHDAADIPETELFPSEAPRTVREMLTWIAGLQNPKHQETLEKCIHNAFKRDDVSAILPLPVNGAEITPQHVIDTIKFAAMFAASVLSAIEPKWRMAVPSLTSASKDSDQSKDADCCALLCQLRDCVYACCHQLEFLRSQCNRDTKHGGWKGCQYGNNVSLDSPLQAFLTDAADSKFDTHLFDPCSICLKSRVNMGFKREDLPKDQQTGNILNDILSPNKWIVKTTKDIEAAQNLVQKILDEVNGNPPASNKNELDKAIETVETRLQERAADLTKWKDAAEKVLQGTITNSETVKGKLDHSKKEHPGATEIGKGIKKIEDAKQKVTDVNAGLQTVHSNLQTWNTTAGKVLGKVVSKAQGVHKRLDPDGSGTLGQKIKTIGNAKNELDRANQTLETQVKALDTWITEAEKIRHAAEEKAKEAYDKLKVNQTLDENVKKIVKANKTIKEVNKSLENHLGSLNSWNQQARDVLTGAIQKANEVYEKLEDKNGDAVKYPVGHQIEAINKASKEIQTANTQLGTEVQHLSSWNTAAQSVIEKAEQKCGEILEKVKQSGPEGVIFTQAQTLKEKGTRLLEAAKDAKLAVEAQVKSALKAVVLMDESLKKDLRSVKEKIKEGITEVITSLEVNKLDQKVIRDLGSLKEKIERLKNEMESSLIKAELEALQGARSTLDGVAGTQGTIKKLTDGLETKFKSVISDPLDEKVDAVDTAIGKLGGKFGGTDKIHGIFGHIKDKVGEIKGSTNGKGSGLEGIVKRVKDLANAFVNSGYGKGFNARVGGWLEGVIGNGKDKKGLQSVTSWFEQYQNVVTKHKYKESDLKDQVKNKIMLHREISQAIAAAQGQIIEVKNDPNSITQNLKAIVSACEEFVKELDKKITRGTISGLADPIAGGIRGWMNGQSLWQRSLNEDDLKCAVRYSLIALCAGVKQVSTEINSLGTDKFGKILDDIKPKVDGLHTALDEATKPGKSPPGQPGSPAQAVDSKLGEVKNEVNNNIVTKFRENVIKELKEAVRGLPGAVQEFDRQAQTQIKEAARTYLSKALSD
ncbi:Ribosome-binding protein 1, putative [Babesia ovata]|uniref:Ribosome-binding protein 1, putative n=1 Tax=Babesia ovata TaxID=189622 RepID=A0A2H6KCV4_9APIC|nr:Ribosome-binding protein 1, putative [Babesia ovata]GBE60804.1 Ribosome-binding protein 1, putative [Babesia ovata]